MTHLKRIVSIGAVVFTVGATSLIAFAASNYSNPAEAVAGLTGKTVESVIEEKNQTGKTYGTIADEAGQLTEFKNEILEIKKDVLAQKVAAGTITQEKADEIIVALEENQLNCDGTGLGKIGQKLGAGFGGMKGQGRGLSRCGQGSCGGWSQIQ